MCMMFVMILVFIFFFFKQKTAYEMRISDWSSDVCSSDLAIGAAQLAIHVERYIEHREKDREFAEDRQVQKPHDGEQQQHERNRVSDEDEMVVDRKSVV